MGIRQKIAEEFGSSPNKEGKLGKQHADGWSGRMEDSILQGCIPVVIQVVWFCISFLCQLDSHRTSKHLIMNLVYLFIDGKLLARL
jgi:hypothetical protein